ncbi:MAG: outer membrane beta-barrel protein [Prevotellaceae bacterium]|nr:outer membrane beta-barrel protein [Prevotella sp.]MDD7258073.1 outer membrane beta-barrel protein [Prevotellaceae bacterium]MDY6131641.1 outer membrane beta-barrel protein [Prevotella sp.]
MKKLLVVLAVAILGVAQSHAQFYAGGSLGFTSSKLSLGEGTDDKSGSSFKFLPEVGFQFSDNMAFGVSAGYIKGYASFGSIDVADLKAMGNAIFSTATDLGSDNDNLNIKCLRVAPYLRYSLYKNGGFEIFVDGVVGLNAITLGQNLKSFGGSDKGLGTGSSNEDNDITTVEVGLKPGIAFSVSKRVKFVAKMGSVGYQHLSVKDHDFKLSRFGLDLDGNNMLLGAMFYF